MKQVFATRPMAAGLMALGTIAVLVPAGAAQAAPVRGKIQAASSARAADMMGYARTRVAGPSERSKAALADTALFLKVDTSLPIPKPNRHPTIAVAGLRLVPDVASCAVDGTVRFENQQQTAVTLKLGDSEVRLEPGGTHDYECTAGDPQRRVRVKEWPHVRGLVYVGEVGVAGAPDERGAFTLVAPDGKYELLFLSRDGVLDTRQVEIKGASVDLGTIDLTSGVGDDDDDTEAP